VWQAVSRWRGEWVVGVRCDFVLIPEVMVLGRGGEEDEEERMRGEERRKERGERKGERRKEKGEGRREKGEGRRERRKERGEEEGE